ASPEVLVRVQEGTAQLLPIAGTRPRGDTEEEDQALETELKNDPKELAEHHMLVDLGRKDLSRVCQSGTVETVRKQEVERYSHVMHIVSDIKGQLSSKNSSVDALKWCLDRKSTRLNSSHVSISYAVFCLKKKTTKYY